MTAEVKIDTRELDRIVGKLDKTRDDIMTALAFEIETEAKAIAPYDTGALKNSIYTRAKRRSSSPKTMKGHEYDEIPAPSGNMIAVVGSGVEYAVYVEVGTYKMGARPYLRPALEHNTYKLNNGSFYEDLIK